MAHHVSDLPVRNAQHDRIGTHNLIGSLISGRTLIRELFSIGIGMLVLLGCRVRPSYRTSLPAPLDILRKTVKAITQLQFILAESLYSRKFGDGQINGQDPMRCFL